jgi:hypothetical protein
VKKFIFIFIFLLVVIFSFTQYNKIYYSSFINSEGFKSSSIEDKLKLLNDKEFRDNCNEATLSRAIELLTAQVLESGFVEDKIDLLDNPDFIHYANDDLRRILIMSIFDTPDISSSSFNRFLFKVCRSTDFNIVADRIEEKKYVLNSDIISGLARNLNYICKNDEEREKWKRIIVRNTSDIKRLAVEEANKIINDNNFDNKVVFIKSKEYRIYLDQEMKEKEMDSILDAANTEQKLMDFLFKDCSFEDFKFAGDRIEKNSFAFNSGTLYKIKNEINNKFYDSPVWQRIIEKYAKEIQIKIVETAKPIIDNKDFGKKLDLYSSPDFLYFASEETKKQLIDSMSNMSDITRIRLVNFLFNTCSKEEFDFITKRIAETGCSWDYSVITEISNNIRKNNKGFSNTYWNSVIKDYRFLREKKAKELLEKVKGNTTLKEKIELSQSSDLTYASTEVRKEMANITALSAINDGTFEDKIIVFETGNLKYTDPEIRRKLLYSIINDPNITDRQLREVFLICKEEECRITFDKMAEKKAFLPQNYIAKIIKRDLLKKVNQESIIKVFKDNPIGKRQLVVQAREFLQFKNYYKLADFIKVFGDFLKIKPDSDLYKDVEFLKSSSGRPPFLPNRKITESQIIEHKDTPIVKARLLEHFNKVLAEYDEEVKNFSSKDSQSD